MKRLWDRTSLKSFFGKGSLPTQVHFEYLIDSSINKLEDGINRTDKDGLQLSPTGQSNHVISFLKDPVAEHPTWQISLLNDENGTGLSFDNVTEDGDGKVKNVPRLFLGENGKIGVNTTNPRTDLQVNGTIGANARIGTYKIGAVLGNGEWHEILSGLDRPQAFELLARIDGPKGRGKYAMTHAIILLPYGKSRYRIKQTRAYFGWFWNRIELRCSGKVDNFALLMRTRTPYLQNGEANIKIKYHITQLWDDQLFNSL